LRWYDKAADPPEYDPDGGAKKWRFSIVMYVRSEMTPWNIRKTHGYDLIFSEDIPYLTQHPKSVTLEAKQGRSRALVGRSRSHAYKLTPSNVPNEWLEQLRTDDKKFDEWTWLTSWVPDPPAQNRVPDPPAQNRVPDPPAQNPGIWEKLCSFLGCT